MWANDEHADTPLANQITSGAIIKTKILLHITVNIIFGSKRARIGNLSISMLTCNNYIVVYQEYFYNVKVGLKSNIRNFPLALISNGKKLPLKLQ